MKAGDCAVVIRRACGSRSIHTLVTVYGHTSEAKWISMIGISGALPGNVERELKVTNTLLGKHVLGEFDAPYDSAELAVLEIRLGRMIASLNAAQDDLKQQALTLETETGLHALWGKAAGLPGYDKLWWLERQTDLLLPRRSEHDLLEQLAGLGALAQIVEPSDAWLAARRAKKQRARDRRDQQLLDVADRWMVSAMEEAATISSSNEQLAANTLRFILDLYATPPGIHSPATRRRAKRLGRRLSTHAKVVLEERINLRIPFELNRRGRIAAVMFRNAATAIVIAKR